MDRSIPLNADQAKVLFRMYQEEPIVKCCAAKLMHSIFSGGISLNDGTNKPKATQEFAVHLNTTWIPFGCEVNFLLWGFCPYIICKRRHPKTRRVIRYPVALEYGTYEIRFEIDENYEKTCKVYQINYANQPLNMRKPDTRVQVAFYDNATRPTMHGLITTPLSSIVHTVSQVDEINEYALRAEAIRAHPTLFVESTPDSRKFEEVSHLRAFDGEDIEEARTERQTGNTYRKYAAVMASQRMGNESRRTETGYSHLTGKRFRNHRPVWENNIFCVPDGTILSSNTPQAEARSDLLALNMHKEGKCAKHAVELVIVLLTIMRCVSDVVCAVLGVPKSMMFSDTSTGRGSESSDQMRDFTFRRTVDSYKQHIIRVLNDTYQEIYKDNVDCITVPGTPLNSLENIFSCYDRGVINGETMARYIMRTMNASDLDIDTKRMKKFDDHHVNMMMANECPSDPSSGVPKPEPKPTVK